MAKRFSISFCIVMILCSIMVVTSCSCKKAEGGLQNVEQYERYRDIVNGEFQNRARRYDADRRHLIIVDYSIPSNQDRLFIWDAEQDRVVEKFWCAHGFGGESTPEKPVFSNTPGSNCSSLGWYRVDCAVGRSAHYGYNYHVVDGMDATNSNARSRQILIHPWVSVTRDYEAQIDHPMKLDMRCAGCFTTTDEGFLTIDRYVKSATKRLLLLAID